VPGDGLKSEVQQFIVRYFRSVEQLEVLSVLISNSRQSWSVREVFRKIQSSEKSISDCLEYFAREGLVIAEAGGTYRFEANSQFAPLALEFSQAYRERPVTIIELIYRTPSQQIQSFSDAFKLRKEK
jgi:hypothetical protein